MEQSFQNDLSDVERSTIIEQSRVSQATATSPIEGSRADPSSAENGCSMTSQSIQEGQESEVSEGQPLREPAEATRSGSINDSDNVICKWWTSELDRMKFFEIPEKFHQHRYEK